MQYAIKKNAKTLFFYSYRVDSHKLVAIADNFKQIFFHKFIILINCQVQFDDKIRVRGFLELFRPIGADEAGFLKC